MFDDWQLYQPWSTLEQNEIMEVFSNFKVSISLKNQHVSVLNLYLHLYFWIVIIEGQFNYLTKKRWKSMQTLFVQRYESPYHICDQWPVIVTK